MKDHSATFIPVNTKENICLLIDEIVSKQDVLSSKKITAGFDGFVDTIVRIIKTKQPQQAPVLFNKTKEFGTYILEKEGTSFSLELEERSTKLGGNMPIMANALGVMGARVNCVGALGYPEIHHAFKNLSANCTFYSFAEPGTATAFEFNDGKIMMAQMNALNNAGWDKIKELIGIDNLINFYKESDLLCLVNWSEIDASTGLWKGILKDVLPHYKSVKKQTAFFDLSDCSKRSSAEIVEALDLLAEFSTYCNVILSLNKNEAAIVYRTLFKEDAGADLMQTGESIYSKLRPAILLLHTSKKAIAFDKKGTYQADSFYDDKPLLSTGAGDNFNAGFCAAQLLQLSNERAVIFANAVSGCYVSTGISPKLSDIIEFLENYTPQ